VRRTAVRLLVLAVLAAGAAAAVARAATIDKVVVGVSGRNATQGFSPSLYVEVMVEPDYTKVDFDGDSGNWAGPPYRSTTNPNLGGMSKAGWTVYFDKGRTVKQAQTGHFVQSWAPFQAATIDVPHVVGQTRVATIKGDWLLTKGPGDHNVQFEGVLSFPLCRGVVVSAEFSFIEPFTDTDNLGGQIRVYPSIGDKDALSWNRDKAILAPSFIALLGYLPAARITPANILRKAGDTSHQIAGRVEDCTGAAMPGVTVRTGKVSGRADARGIFDLRVPKAGDYAVTATAGGGTARKTLHAG
jgi:hypothetical protein